MVCLFRGWLVGGLGWGRWGGDGGWEGEGGGGLLTFGRKVMVIAITGITHYPSLSLTITITIASRTQHSTVKKTHINN